MCYVITDGKLFINPSGGQHVVNNLDQVNKMKRDKAENVLKALPKILRKYNWEIKYAEAAFTKKEVIQNLKEMKEYLEEDEVELRKLTNAAIVKLNAMTEETFLSLDLYPEF